MEYVIPKTLQAQPPKCLNQSIPGEQNLTNIAHLGPKKPEAEGGAPVR
jgi:hypothetical protein